VVNARARRYCVEVAHGRRLDTCASTAVIQALFTAEGTVVRQPISKRLSSPIRITSFLLKTVDGQRDREALRRMVTYSR
jgi:hypothetical protein